MSNVREILAGASGGVLGYIFNGVRGAKAGYKLARGAAKLTKSISNMPRGNESRRRSYSSSGTPTPLRRMAQLMTPNSSRFRLFARRASRGNLRHVPKSFGVSNAFGSDQPIKKVKRKGKATNVKKKKAHVSRALRNTIKDVVAAKDPIGEYKSYDINFAYPVVDNTQTLSDLQRGLSHDGSAGGCFTPTEILHYASVMWNGKTDSAVRTRTDTGNMNPKATKINVINSWNKFTIKNNTQNKYEVKIYEFEPKAAGIEYPQTVWNDNLNQLAAAGVTNSWTSVSVKSKPNRLKMVADRFKIKEVSLTLEPGMIYIHTVQGPKDWVCDLAKYWKTDSAQMNYSRHSVFPVMVYYPQIQGTASGGAGRYTDISANTAYGFIVENEVFYKLSMPEQAGFVYPASTAAGVYQLLTNRIDKMYHKSWLVSQGGLGAAIQIDDENPATTESSAI